MLGSQSHHKAWTVYVSRFLNARGDGRERSMGTAWICTAVALAGYFAAWWGELHPGVFTDDSGKYIAQSVSGDIENIKPFFYARFLQCITIGGRYLESAALVQAGFGVLILSRMFAVGWVNRAPVLLLGLCAALVLSPYFAVTLFYIQNDILFCLAMVAILVETIHCAAAGRVGRGSVAMIALMAPMALLFRQNGILFIPFWAVSLPFLLPRPQSAKLIVAALATCLLAAATIMGVRTDNTLNTKYSAVVHAIAGLSRPEYGKPVAANISSPTRELLGAYRLDEAVDYYSPKFWDFVGFDANGPRLVSLSKTRQQEIVDSFVRHDLWPNFPGVVGIRSELWLSILMGRGFAVEAYGIPRWVPDSLIRAKIANPPHGGLLTQWVRYQEQSGWVRSAWPGFVVLAVLWLLALWQHNRLMLWSASLLLLQAAVIFVLAPSADSRYLLFLYLAPFIGLFAGAWRRIPLASAGPCQLGDAHTSVP